MTATKTVAPDMVELGTRLAARKDDMGGEAHAFANCP
jgi:hypothetical protein